MAYPIITTRRLIIRPFEEQDLQPLAKILGDPQVMRFSVGGPFSLEKTQQFIRLCKRRYQERGYWLWAVEFSETQDLIGYCGLIDQIVDRRQEVELAYRLSSQWWNRGLGTEAAAAVRDYAFEQLGLEHIVSIIPPENIPSRRVAEKIGMRPSTTTTFYGWYVIVYEIDRQTWLLLKSETSSGG